MPLPIGQRLGLRKLHHHPRSACFPFCAIAGSGSRIPVPRPPSPAVDAGHSCAGAPKGQRCGLLLARFDLQCDAACGTGFFPLCRRAMSESSNKTELGASAVAVYSLMSDILPRKSNTSVYIDRWREVRVFLVVMTAEPVFILFRS